MSGFTKRVRWEFFAAGQFWVVTYFTDTTIDFEETRKNGPEEEHMAGSMALRDGRWVYDLDHLEMDPGSTLSLGDDTVCDGVEAKGIAMLEEFFNIHGCPVDTTPSIAQAMADVQEFHNAIEYLPDRGWLPPAMVKRLSRSKFTREEYTELQDATIEGDLAEVADAYADLIYVILGSAIIQFGAERFALIWDEVHRSNMAKRGPDGKFARNSQGKVIKPDGWSPPNIKELLELDVAP